LSLKNRGNARIAGRAKAGTRAGLPALFDLFMPRRGAAGGDQALPWPGSIMASQVPRILEAILPISKLINRIVLLVALNRIIRMLDPLRALGDTLGSVLSPGAGGSLDLASLLTALGPLLTPASR